MSCCGCGRRGKKKKMSNKKKNSTIPKNSFILKEGFMDKRCGVIKMWKPRYFVLLDDLLCYFLKEEQKESLVPSGRIFFCDIDMIDRVNKKSHPFSLQIQTDSKRHVFSCSTFDEREDWVNQISTAKDRHKNQELNDPVRRRSTRLGKDSKRITIKKDPKHGIGCTIKNVGGAIFVSRIIPDGPVATSGALRPGDQIIDINGNRVSECPIEKIKEIIRGSPEYVVCTVKPVTHYTNRDASPSTQRKAYTEVDPELLQGLSDEEEIPYTSIGFDKNASNNGKSMGYAEVNFHSASVSESIEEDHFLTDEKVVEEQYNGQTNPDYMNAEAFEFEHDKVTKKLTNYAQLEFGTRR